MTGIDLDTPIGEFARTHPEHLAALDRLRIDYCCHGKETIRDACTRAGVAADALAQALRDAPAAAAGAPERPDPASLGMSALCDEIVSHYHASARTTLERLCALADRVEAAHGARDPAVGRLVAIVRGLREEMHEHMVREEKVLFPWIRRLESPRSILSGPPWSVKRPIGCMMHDHDEMAAAFEEVRRLAPRLAGIRAGCATTASLLDALGGFELETRRHVHAENNILFPAAVRAEAGRAVAREGVAR